MWLLLVAVGSGYLVRCWHNALQQRAYTYEQEGEEEDDRPQEAWLSDQPSANEQELRTLAVLDEMSKRTVDSGVLKKRGKDAMHMDPGFGIGRRTSKKLFEMSEEVRDTDSSGLVKSCIDCPTQRGDEQGSVPLVSAGKRTIEFSKHSMHDGDLAGFEVKRMKDSQEIQTGQAQEQSFLSAFTCSFLDNPGFSDLWFTQQHGEGRNRGNGRTPGNKSGRSRGMSRRSSRYMRASPNPVSSLESCLRAQLRFDEDKQISHPLCLHSYEEGRSRGLREVEALGEVGLGKNYGAGTLYLPPLLKHVVSRKHVKPTGSSSQDALLFSFGVGVGVMHMLSSSKAEIERLKGCLRETEKLVQDLQLQLQSRESTLKEQSDVKLVETTSEGQDSVRSGLTVEQQGNMAELEAQLEAELELMQLHSTELDTEEMEEVVHDHLNFAGLPGAFESEDDRNHSGHAEGIPSNWAVSPRELDKRLRQLLETRQEERITQLEEELQNAETQLLDKEQELQLWKNRVRHLTELTLSSSGEKEDRDEDAVSSGVEVRNELDRNELEPSISNRYENSTELQSPGDDICDEFLKAVSAERPESPGLEDEARDASSSNVSEYGESWLHSAVQREHDACTPEPSYFSSRQPDELFMERHGQKSTDLEREVALRPGRSSPAWNCSFIRHAGAGTPIEELRSNKRFNTPRSRKQESVMEKIKYWENLAKGNEGPSSPDTTGHQSQVSPLRFSCSEAEGEAEAEGECEAGSSWDNSSVSDHEEEHLGDVLIKRIVEKSRKGTLLKDVQMMLAALDSSSESR